jgi:hypothetical protein
MYLLYRRMVDYTKWLYMQYLLNTALYMLEPFEVRMFNIIIVCVIVTWIYSTYVFLPSQMVRIWTTMTSDSMSFEAAASNMATIPTNNGGDALYLNRY